MNGFDNEIKVLIFLHLFHRYSTTQQTFAMHLVGDVVIGVLKKHSNFIKKKV